MKNLVCTILNPVVINLDAVESILLEKKILNSVYNLNTVWNIRNHSKYSLNTCNFILNL